MTRRAIFQPSDVRLQLVVVTRHEHHRGVRVLLEDLQGGEIGEGLRLVALDLDLVWVELVVLPDARRGGLFDPCGEGVGVRDRLAVAVLGPDVVREDAADAGIVELVDGGRVLEQRVHDVEAVLQGLHARVAESVVLTGSSPQGY